MAESRRVPFVSLPTATMVIMDDDDEEKQTPPGLVSGKQHETAMAHVQIPQGREAGERRQNQQQLEAPQRQIHHEPGVVSLAVKEQPQEVPQQGDPETRHVLLPRDQGVTPSSHSGMTLVPQREAQQREPGVTSEPRREQEARHLEQQRLPQRDAEDAHLAAGAVATQQPPGEPPVKRRRTVRLELALRDPTEESCAEYSYPELLGGTRSVASSGSPATPQKKPPQSDDPFNDDERERLQVETLAKKFEAKYGGKVHKHRKDRMQDLIDIGYGYDETDPFIDNSEAYDELVPASLTTKHGGFYINTGTLQFRQTSDSEDEDFAGNKKHRPSKVSKLKDGEDRTLKKRKRKEDGSDKEKRPRKMKVSNQMGVMSLNSHKPEKKKRKHYKDSLALAAMIRKFEMEKDAMKKEPTQDPPVLTVVNSTLKTPSARNDLSDFSLGSDPVLSIFGSTNERELLQEAENALEMLGDLDFDQLLEAASNDSPLSDVGEENGILVQDICHGLSPKQIPDLPEGLPAHLEKRIEDLRAAAKLFDEEGRKKFFTQDMNNILLDIELQLQELNPSSRSGVYAHIEAFVPCNKDSLIKRLKKLHLNVQDDRLREPLQRLKVAVCNIMPLQIARFQDHCQAHNQAKSAKLQAGEAEKNGSEDDDEEKPGKRVVGPRKKFHWDEMLRSLLCNLVKIKLGCYELEPTKSQSAEDYLKNFMETEVKPLWPKGWMQARMLFKESRSVHNHLTSSTAKKKVILAPKPKVKESSPKKEQKTSTPLVTAARVSAPMSVAPVGTPLSSNCIPASETICLDDSLDSELPFNAPSMDSVSDTLTGLNGTKMAAVNSSLDTPTSRPRSTLREEKLATIMSKLPLGAPKKAEPAHTPHSSSLIAGQSASVPKKPHDLAAHAAITSGLIAGSSIQNPKVSLEPLPAKLLQQGLQRSMQAQVSSTSTQAQASSPCSSLQTPVLSSLSSTTCSQTHVHSSSSSLPQSSSSPSTSQMTKMHQQTSIQQTYVSPLQATVCKSQANPVVRLTNSPHICSSTPVTKTPEKHRQTSSAPSSGSSPQSSQPLVSRASSSSTSTNYLAKSMCNQSATLAFKSPYTMAPSCKTSTTPSSSSASILVAQSTSHQKQPGGNNINRQSPTISMLSSNHTAFQPVKSSQTSAKMANPAPRMVNPATKMPSTAPKVPNPVQKMGSPTQKMANATQKMANPDSKVANAALKMANPLPKMMSPVPKVVSPTPKMAGPAPSLPTPAPKLSSPAPKIANPSPRLPSPSPRLPSPSPKLPSPVPKLPTPTPKPPSPAPKPPSPAPKHISPASKPPSPAPKLNNPCSGPINRSNVNLASVNVPIRSNVNSNVTNRTNLPGGAGNGTQGASKQLSQHRPSSASGSPVTGAIVQSTAGASLLASTSPLTLMTSPLSVTNPNVASSPLAPFSMLGGLVPVTVPFQFPLELLGFGSDTVTTSSGTTSAVFHHSLAQNGGQSKGDKLQRKTQ
ncbi:ubinuclein-2 isoform X2 [Ambystoma mexicanum]|uniref:ubinuclein-2 isoform X2 n=1 Tax=Ambystoma mexicanum TaxID=8296 RepID=UPI0037E76A7A